MSEHLMLFTDLTCGYNKLISFVALFNGAYPIKVQIYGLDSVHMYMMKMFLT